VGKKIITTTDFNKISIYDYDDDMWVLSGTAILSLSVDFVIPPMIYSVCFSPDGKSIACRYTIDVVLIFDIYQMHIDKQIDNECSCISCLCYSLDGLNIIIGSNTGTIKIINCQSGQLVGQFIEEKMQMLMPFCQSMRIMFLRIHCNTSRCPP
jgi:WD40 repeat protein